MLTFPGAFLKERIDYAVRTIIFGVIAASAGIASFLFSIIAVFLWTQQHYDTIIACSAVGGMFLLVAIFALVTLAIFRRRAVKAASAKAAATAANAPPAWLAEPVFLLSAIQIARSIGLGKLIPLALAGVAAFGTGALLAGGRTTNK